MTNDLSLTETDVNTDVAQGQKSRSLNPVLFSSQSVHWATPKGVYDTLNTEFSFDFDPCPLQNQIFDGTATSWTGRRVYCNPPYNAALIPFLRKANEADISVFLLPAWTDTKWFHDLVLPSAKEIRFVKGRLKFGESKNSAPFPSMVVVFRKAPSVPNASKTS